MGKHELTELRGILIGAATALACVCSRTGLLHGMLNVCFVVSGVAIRTNILEVSSVRLYLG